MSGPNVEGGRPSRHHGGRDPAPSRGEQVHRQRIQSGQQPTTTTQTQASTARRKLPREYASTARREHHQPLAGKTVLQFSLTTAVKAVKANQRSVRNSHRSSAPVSRLGDSKP